MASIRETFSDFVSLKGREAVVSDYLKNTRSLEELDRLFELDRIAVAEVAQASFKHSVAIGKAGIGETQQVASARIFADVQVATTKITVDTDVTVKLLAMRADAVMLDIQNRISGHPSMEPDVLTDMITEVGRVGSVTISEQATVSIARIEQEAQNAIERIKALGAEAIKSIDEMSEDISKQIAQNAADAETKLEKTKSQSRKTEDAIRHAEGAAALVKLDGEDFRRQVIDAVAGSINDIMAISDTATAKVKACVEQSEEVVIAARKRALQKVQDIVDHMLADRGHKK